MPMPHRAMSALGHKRTFFWEPLLDTHEGYCSRGRLFQLLRHSIRFVTVIARKRDDTELLAQLVTVG
jgi:hypothetical protein